MKLKIVYKFFLSFLILIVPIFLLAQKSSIYTDTDRDYKLASELFNKQKFASAQALFNKIVEKYGESYSDVKTDAEYYSALCALELFNNNAEYLIAQFIVNHPESPRIRIANFQMGKFQYRMKNYIEALKWFKKVDKYDLNNDDLAEYYFKVGYSYFVQNDIQAASKAFYEIKDGGSKFSAPAMYYYSHIAYDKANYETALEGFISLSKNDIFASVVPYYISQIYYLQEKYNKLLNYATNFVDSASAKRAPEIARIIGEAYYRSNKFEEAIPYLEKYKEGADSYSREDIYELAFSYYSSKKFSKAVKYFPSITNVNDQLTQNTYYHLADCYLNMNDKKNARLAFFSASQLDFNMKIKEISMLNYAKLTYELAFSPFNETITTFENFIKEFPKSKRVDDAYNYLVDVYLTSKNYKDALISIEKIEDKSPELLKAYQRVTYFRGLELINNLQYEKAIKILNKSITVAQYNKTIKAKALYWKGEAYYKLKKYDEAINMYKEFLLTPGAFLLPEFKLAYYNLGYSYFKKKDYNGALSWFRKFADNKPEKKPNKLNDAYIRIGDIYFINRDYKRAIKFYGNAVKLNAIDSDYALFQQGFSYGLLKNNNQKINNLKKIIEDTASSYFDDALFEIAKSYIEIDSLPLAIASFEKIVINFPNSDYLKKSILQLGLLYYNTDKNQEAIAMYKRVMSDYPGSQESKDALIGLKNIYVDMNDVDAYFKYVATLGDFADVRYSEQDSLSYLSAENLYISRNFEVAKNQFDDYIHKFPTGSFVLNAYYYKADCQLKLDQTDEALKSLKFIIEKPKNEFTEPALLISSSLHFEQEEYTEAIEDYALLENVAVSKTNLLTARLGLLRSTYLLKAYKQTIVAANKLFHTENVPAEVLRETNYKMANSYLKLDDLDNALKQFRILATDVSVKEGAEARYRVAEILFRTNKYLQAEDVIFNFKNTPYRYWLAKSFIILSDIYKINDDLFQAKATLESIIQNYKDENDEIIQIANEKIAVIEKIENERMPGKSIKSLEINFNENNSEYDDLYNNNKKQSIENIKTPDSLIIPKKVDSLIIIDEDKTIIDTLKQQEIPVYKSDSLIK